jgi:hypothetical protein
MAKPSQSQAGGRAGYERLPPGSPEENGPIPEGSQPIEDWVPAWRLLLFLGGGVDTPGAGLGSPAYVGGCDPFRIGVLSRHFPMMSLVPRSIPGCWSFDGFAIGDKRLEADYCTLLTFGLPSKSAA